MLKDLKSDRRRHFSATRYYAVYDDHVDTLMTMEERQPSSALKVLKDIFETCMYVWSIYGCVCWADYIAEMESHCLRRRAMVAF